MYVVHRAPTYKGYIPYTTRVIAQAAYRRALSRTVKAEPSHLVAAVGFGSRTKDDETQKACKRFMSTRSGLLFRIETTMVEKEAATMNDVLRLLMETQQRQVEAEHRREEERRQERREEERIRREESERIR